MASDCFEDSYFFPHGSKRGSKHRIEREYGNFYFFEHTHG